MDFSQLRTEEIEAAALVLSRLVSIPSLTLAAGQAAPDSRYGEARAAAEVAGWLRAAGAEVSVEEIEPGRPQVTARMGCGAPELLFTSHLDTVVPVGWRWDPFQPRREGDRLIGLGACDDKGSLTAMLLAFARLLRQPHPTGTVTFIAMVGEEMFGVGSRHLVRSGYRPDAAIVGEPTEMRLVRVECGNVRWRIHTRGRAAHGSRPWEGDSALYRMADVLRLLRDEIAPGCRARSHPLTGPAACNAGLIQGGSAVNIVPDGCTLTLERRILPGEDPKAEMDAINARLAAEFGAGTLEFEAPLTVNYPLETPDDHLIVRAVRSALLRVGGSAAATGVTYGSDANRLAEVGTPCVVFGPGSIAQAHTAEEWVDLREVALAARVLEAGAKALLGAALPPA